MVNPMVELNIEEKIINGEPQTRDSIVEVHKRLVHMVANRFRKRADTLGFEYDDIVSIGFIGLLKAFDKFDGEQFNVRFSTYAVPMIKGEIQRELRDKSQGFKISRTTKEIMLKLMYDKTLEDKTDEEVAKLIDKDVKYVVEARKAIVDSHVKSFEDMVYNSGKGDEDLTILEKLGEEEDYTSIFVQEFVDLLTDKQKKVLECAIADMTQNQIGEACGVSQVQVSRILKTIGSRYIQYKNESLDIEESGRDFTMATKGKGDLKRAKKLLAETDMSIPDIAEVTRTNIATLYNYSKKYRPEPVSEHAKKVREGIARSKEKSNESKIHETVQNPKPKEELMSSFKELSPAMVEALENQGTVAEDRIAGANYTGEDFASGFITADKLGVVKAPYGIALEEVSKEIKPEVKDTGIEVKLKISKHNVLVKDLQGQLAIILEVLNTVGAEEVSLFLTVEKSNKED